jgi:isopentenyl-diphosphate Delta-isomerase
MIERIPSVVPLKFIAIAVAVSLLLQSMLLGGSVVGGGTGRSVLLVQSFVIRNSGHSIVTRPSAVVAKRYCSRTTLLGSSTSSNRSFAAPLFGVKVKLDRSAAARTGSNLKMTTSSSLSLHAKNANGADYGVDMDQDALMETDMLVAVDENDILIPRVVLSKKEGHTFTQDTPRATLHRAFSLFLFNAENKLLLTQRAASKITFPNVWTNTLCSHPLYDMVPNEADVTPEAYPHFPGIKQAAVRKGRHELGLSPQDLPVEQMQFITRFHYWAADTVTYGPSSPWGEHEVDYILFLKSNALDVPVQAHPDEVANYKYVSLDELKEMRRDPSLLWSPWFLGILDRGGYDWWANLDDALSGAYTNDVVTYFDPPDLHVGQYNLASHTRQTGVLKATKSSSDK